MIIRNEGWYIKFKRYYSSFADWWNDFKKDKPLLTASPSDVIYCICLILFVLLAIFLDPIWRPFLHYYYPDSVPLLNYDPYIP